LVEQCFHGEHLTCRLIGQEVFSRKCPA
jgi:hypothetical protein